MQKIQEYAKSHEEMRAGFLNQYFKWSEKKGRWGTESFSRNFAVWTKWDIVDGSLRGRFVLDHPLETTAQNVFDNFCNCLEKINIPTPEKNDENWDVESLRGHLSSDTVSVG